MDAEHMELKLQNRSEELRDELLELEREFNTKKEQYIKIQGALEALRELDREDSEDTE
tara:strand:+ start:1041 stop:1214 length:174 start_codon:yes stop_codon:yes gene_type:complete